MGGAGEKLDFGRLDGRWKPNNFLICPQGFSHVEPDLAAPVFACPIERLRQAWDEALVSERRLEILNRSADGCSLEYVQRTRVFRFPDRISVRLLALGSDQATLALYSRAVYGLYDLGVNARRGRRWLARLLGLVPAKLNAN